MLGKVIVVKAARDADAGVWFVGDSDLAGLNLEADTLEALAEKLPGAILDLLEAGAFDGEYDGTQEIPVELIAHARTKVSRPAAP